MPAKTLQKRSDMLDEVTTTTSNQFKAYANIYCDVPEIGSCPPWKICTVSKDSNLDGYFTAIDEHEIEHKLPVYHIAFDSVVDFELSPKTRVIAQRKQMFFPCFYNDQERTAAFIYKNFDESTFFAGVISDEYRHGDGGCLEYLVLFDDGHAQYVRAHHIRLVNGKSGIKHVPENIRNFLYYYFGAERTVRRKADCQINDILRVLLNGKFRNAKVRKFFGHHLIMVHFLEENIIEWIFVGSDRIEIVHKSVCNFLKEKDMGHVQSKDIKTLNEELFYSNAYKNKLTRSRGQQSGRNDIYPDINKKDQPEVLAESTKSSASQISYNDPKMAVEFLIILAEIRHEMNRSGNAKHRIDLYAERSLNRRKPVWKRICRFLRVKVDQRNRTGLKMLIQNFRNIDIEFRNAYDYYTRPQATMPKSPANHPKTIGKDAMTIQQEVTSKVQLMQKYLDIRANGDDNNTPGVNLVQNLDDVINEFSKLTKQYYNN